MRVVKGGGCGVRMMRREGRVSGEGEMERKWDSGRLGIGMGIGEALAEGVVYQTVQHG